MTEQITTLLKNNSYPGRGLFIGMSEDAAFAVIGYFIMGRSTNSRNRIFCEEGANIMIKPFDESKVEDPSLIIYYPLRVLGSETVVSNGDQTDTIAHFLQQGETFAAALRTRTYEPDTPNFTPRISGIASYNQGAFSYKFSILKRWRADNPACVRQFFEYEPLAGQGHFIHTYTEDGNPLPSFNGEPTVVSLAGAADIDCFATHVWDSLNADNKVSLVVRAINLADHACQTKIINRNC
jgi:IMP cyclohydrolase